MSLEGREDEWGEERGEKKKKKAVFEDGEDDFGRLGHMYKTFRRLFN